MRTGDIMWYKNREVKVGVTSTEPRRKKVSPDYVTNDFRSFRHHALPSDKPAVYSCLFDVETGEEIEMPEGHYGVTATKEAQAWIK